ncbi:MAG: type II toxin-antitoxin system RelE/ParE family toxin [Anaerolineae bacterium]|jgi:mRNA-degrading endonuclease RelE of RelBE toxin-antitoxin system|nr:type II toxin-antitoxin system RelE/ParE family toxin [Anaerolineae bacterium]
MPTIVSSLPQFNRDLKHLKRKYPSILSEVRELSRQLENDERPGDLIPNLNREVYKVRLRNKSAERGKSGGFRVIYYVRYANTVFLLTAYSKTEQELVSNDEIQALIDSIPFHDESYNGDEED